MNYFVDTEVKSFKWHGPQVRNFSITDRGIKIGKNVKSFGLFDKVSFSYVRRLFGVLAMQRSRSDRTHKVVDVPEDRDFDEILFSDIKRVSLEKLSMVGGEMIFERDSYVVLELKNDEVIKFFATDEFNTRNAETEEIYRLISEMIAGSQKIGLESTTVIDRPTTLGVSFEKKGLEKDLRRAAYEFGFLAVLSLFVGYFINDFGVIITGVLVGVAAFLLGKLIYAKAMAIVLLLISLMSLLIFMFEGRSVVFHLIVALVALRVVRSAFRLGKLGR